MLELHTDSHLDHGLTGAQVAYLQGRFHDKSEFFIETVELPECMGTVPCRLYGPIMGDEPIGDSDVTYKSRGRLRTWESRSIYLPLRPSRLVTVIAGQHDGKPCVLFTAFGGPLAPKEPKDPNLRPDERKESRRFWAEHALAIGESGEHML